jgi:hypothetical protein
MRERFVGARHRPIRTRSNKIERSAIGQERAVASRSPGVGERAEGGHPLVRPGNTTKL